MLCSEGGQDPQLGRRTEMLENNGFPPFFIPLELRSQGPPTERQNWKITEMTFLGSKNAFLGGFPLGTI